MKLFLLGIIIEIYLAVGLFLCGIQFWILSESMTDDEDDITKEEFVNLIMSMIAWPVWIIRKIVRRKEKEIISQRD